MTRTRLWHLGEMALLAGRFGAACTEARMMLVRAKHASTAAVREEFLRDARRCGAEARGYWQELQKVEVSA
jgi:hypothetical protein